MVIKSDLNYWILGMEHAMCPLPKRETKQLQQIESFLINDKPIIFYFFPKIVYSLSDEIAKQEE